MLSRRSRAMLGIAALITFAPAAAQVAPQSERDPNVGTETQERIAEGQTNDFDWGILGLLGLLGLVGLRRRTGAYGNAR
jgi:MYXO-CTERM domain-containing protein